MRRLHTKVNLIPVIAKADTMTDEEIADFKQRVKLRLGTVNPPLTEPLSDSFRYCLPQYPYFPSPHLR